MIMIIALYSAVALLAAPSLGQDSGNSTLTSPCHSVFTYDPPGPEPGSWSGIATLSTDTLLYSLWLNIVLDNSAWSLEPLEQWGKTTTHDNVNFWIEKDDLQLHPDQPVRVRFSVQYDSRYTTPKLREIRLNGKAICDAQALQLPQSDQFRVNSDQRSANVPITTNECGVTGGKQTIALINNGNFYERGEIPWLVAIYRIFEEIPFFICAGTLVSERHVVTAAHCMKSNRDTTPLSEILIKAGVHRLNDWKDDMAVTRYLMTGTIHEKFNSSTLQNDIMILTLDESIKFTNYIRPACLWSGETKLSEVVGTRGIVAGWGDRSVLDIRGKLDEPQFVRVPIVSTIECRGSKDVFHHLTYDTTLCAGDRNGTGPCKGDSGGGLYLMEGGKWRLRGIVSIALKNTALTCDLNEYVVYTDTAQFLPWIRNNILDTYLPTENRIAKTLASPATPATSATSTPRIYESVECGFVAGNNNARVTRPKEMPYMRGDIPWLVAIYNNSSSYICGGTLVSDRHVITAASGLHLIYSQSAIETIIVRVGVHNVSDWSEDFTVTRNLVSASIHEDYNENTLLNNIMILTLSERVRFNDFIRPACLWSGNTDLSRVVVASGVVAGWGIQSMESTGLHDEPRTVRATIVSTRHCRSRNPLFEAITSNKTLCAGDRNDEGPCVEDSGAGLYLLEGGRWTLRGLVSSTLRAENGSNNCKLDEYVVYTDTAQFLPWIRRILSQKYID